MRVTLKKPLVENIGMPVLKTLGINEDAFRWHDAVTIDLSDYTTAQTKKLKALIEKTAPEFKRQAGQHVRDIDMWLKVREGDSKEQKVRRLDQFDAMLFEFMKQNSPNKWLYTRADDGTLNVQYLSSFKYVPPKQTRDYPQPAYVELRLACTRFGKTEFESRTLKRADVVGLTVPQVLANLHLMIETPDLRAEYDAEVARYTEVFDKVGRQVLIWGAADVVPEEEDRFSYRWSVDQIIVGSPEEPSKAVVDIFENEKPERGEREHISASFWAHKRPSDHEGDEDDDDNVAGPGDEDVDQSDPHSAPYTVPLDRKIVVFSLKKHMHMTLRATQTRDYVYDEKLGSRLVLPDEDLHLVNMLVHGQSQFKDIISGKAGGSIILCTGLPGTGKTLTAEVYSEVMKRPLYSVQCSQLGIEPDELEKELLKSFTRASRWKAILLLDEADVYVSARGSDLMQNAIVGVFLRVLEYYNGVLFLTTNRIDNIDDAISSRCVARLVYGPPTPANQKRIWQVLSYVSGIALAEPEVDRIVATSPNLTGRDVKNLLKLGSLIAGSAPITHAVIEYVKRFKPTR